MVSRVSVLTLVVGCCAAMVWGTPAFADSYNPRLDSDGATVSTSASQPVRAAAYLPPRSREADRRVVIVQRSAASTDRQDEGHRSQPHRTSASTGGEARSEDPASVSNPRRVIATRPQPQVEPAQPATERARDAAAPMERLPSPTEPSEAAAAPRQADDAGDEPAEVYASGIFLNEQDLGPDVEQRFAPVEAQEVDERHVQQDSADSSGSGNPVVAAQYLPESARGSQQASGGYRQLYDSHPQQQVHYSPSISSGYTSQQRTTVHYHHHHYHHQHYRPRPVYVHRTYYCPPPRRIIYHHRPVYHRHHFHRPHRKYYHRSTSVGVRYRGDRWRVGVRLRF